MPHLRPDLHSAVVEVVKAHALGHLDRETILTGVLAPEVLQNRIKWTGTAFQFATGLVDELTHQELIDVLLQVKRIVGTEQRELIDSLVGGLVSA